MRSQKVVVPFLKWAGGKRWLIGNHRNFFDFSESERYVEPFLGSGAVFFGLRPRRAVLNDSNDELIATYLAIRIQWRDVALALADPQRRHSAKYYYSVRSQQPSGLVERAARVIYLNRTCFNAIYRVNLDGKFNVPIGTKNSVVLKSDDFEEISRRLRGAKLLCGDFETVIDDCGPGDFIFADPPYTVKHNSNGFVKYNERLFSWSDQLRLSGSLHRAAARGATVVLSNADHESVRDLYADSEVVSLQRQSVMASSADRRRMTTEILVRLGGGG